MSTRSRISVKLRFFTPFNFYGDYFGALAVCALKLSSTKGRGEWVLAPSIDAVGVLFLLSCLVFSVFFVGGFGPLWFFQRMLVSSNPYGCVEVSSPRCCFGGGSLLVFGFLAVCSMLIKPSICFLHRMCDQLLLKIRIMSP